MVDNDIKTSLGTILIIAAYVVFIECSTTQANEANKANGVVGANITLTFSFNHSVTNESHFAIYKGKDRNKRKKIAEYNRGPLLGSKYVTYPKNGSVFCNLTNLTLNHRDRYTASLFLESSWNQAVTESEVELIVHQDNISTVTTEAEIPITENSGSSSSSHIITAVLVVTPVVLLTVTLIWLIWGLMKTKDKQELPPHQNPPTTIQETVEAPSPVPAPPLIYSVLDFPKRASAIQEVNSRDTEYAAVSYLTEKRGM